MRLRHNCLVALSPMKLILSFLAIACSAMAGESVLLSSGFRMHALSHTTDGNLIKLQTDQGVIEIPVASVVGIEQEEAIPSGAALAAATEPSKTAANPQELVTRAAVQAGLPPEFVRSIAHAESGFKADAVSPKGAIGLMQLMPGTAAQLNANPHDPTQNAEAGAQYLRELLLKYQNDPHQVLKAIAAYNAGPGAVDKYKGVPPYAETIEYVKRVLKEYEREQKKADLADQAAASPATRSPAE